MEQQGTFHRQFVSIFRPVNQEKKEGKKEKISWN